MGALGTAIHSFVDNMQSHSPGYRDRVVRIYLSSREGGLNLDMPERVIQAISKRGAAAGAALVNRFAPGGAQGGEGWRNHVFVRLRSFLGLFEAQFRRIGFVLGTPRSPEAADLDALVRNPPSYGYTEAEEETALRALDLLREVSARIRESEVRLDRGLPRPTPELRVTPKI